MLASLTCKQISSSHSFRYGSLRYCRLWTENWKRGSMFRIHAIISHQGDETEELTRERRMRWISAISRGDLTELKLKNERVCSPHFVSGKPAQLWDKFNIDWVPTLNLTKNGLEYQLGPDSV